MRPGERWGGLLTIGWLLTGCATPGALPVANAGARRPLAQPDQGIEVRHMYLFAPGKPPVKIVARQDRASPLDELSSEPPLVR